MKGNPHSKQNFIFVRRIYLFIFLNITTKVDLGIQIFQFVLFEKRRRKNLLSPQFLDFHDFEERLKLQVKIGFFFSTIHIIFLSAYRSSSPITLLPLSLQ